MIRDQVNSILRLKDYDYSQPGAYYITICAHNRECIFGKIENGEMMLNEYGEIAYNEWIKLKKRYQHIELDFFQIMPNHIHGIIFIHVGATLAVAPDIAVTIGNIIGAYKSLVSNECLKIFELQNEYMGKLWQRNFYEQIIRNENELNRIKQYIIDNPKNWESDDNYLE